ncbi:MAG: hypothetical protein V4598_04775 [Bdellovibrionota bacterium]
MWILKNRSREFLFLYLPGMLAVLASIFYPDLGEESLLYGLLAMGVIDSGHVYTTMWRTWLHKDEVVTDKLYFIFPIVFFFLFSLWFYLEIPYLWAFVVYSTLYHHTRQVYGFSKWYQKINKRQDTDSDRYLYFFAYFPMVIYHFRPEAIGSYYTDKDLFLYPQTALRDFFLYFYLMVVLTWGYREWRLWQSGIREPNRIVSVAYPGAVYAFCFLVGNTVTQILFPLLFIHGIAYFGVMGQTMAKTQKRFQNEGIAILVVLVTALVFGLSESWFEENLISHQLGASPILHSLIIGISLTPLYCHYAFDAMIWRKNHREAGLTFS